MTWLANKILKSEKREVREKQIELAIEQDGRRVETENLKILFSHYVSSVKGLLSIFSAGAVTKAVRASKRSKQNNNKTKSRSLLDMAWLSYRMYERFHRQNRPPSTDHK